MLRREMGSKRVHICMLFILLEPQEKSAFEHDTLRYSLKLEVLIWSKLRSSHLN